jgi:hypothetical protein
MKSSGSLSFGLAFGLALGVALASGCGKEIGDSCLVSTDCDQNGLRECDTTGGSPDGYCTIQGCDYDTCPDEAVCVRFFSGEFENKLCTYATEGTSTFDCTLDELCDLDGHCVPRSSETRFCMRKCSTDGDCRSGYECRDFDKMISHGGEDVLPPGEVVTDKSPKFCATKPAS